MTNLKITLIEDENDSIETFQRSCKVFSRKNNIQVDLTCCKNLSEFKDNINNIIDCDGIVIDMKLNTVDGEEDGSDIVDYFAEHKIIIPTVIFTGTDDVALSKHPFINILTKSNTSIEDDILTDFFKIKSTGVIDILGGKGILKDYLYEVFHKNIDRQKESWFAYAQNDYSSTRNALLRHTINHLSQYIDEENNEYFLQEMYIYPPIAQKIKPGSILKNLSGTSKDYIILTPACDLANEKAHCILLCEIVSPKELIRTKVSGDADSKIRIKNLENFTKNKNPNYHFLPPMFDFEGGFVDFSSVISVSPLDCRTQYTNTHIQISNAFIADIIARFSIYYARQGQPDLKHKDSYFLDLLKSTPYMKQDTSL